MNTKNLFIKGRSTCKHLLCGSSEISQLALKYPYLCQRNELRNLGSLYTIANNFSTLRANEIIALNFIVLIFSRFENLPATGILMIVEFRKFGIVKISFTLISETCVGQVVTHLRDLQY